jgi:NAD(P)H-dependent FMN reductase
VRSRTGRIAGARAALHWHGTLSEMGMIVISSTLAVGPIAEALSAEGKPVGEAGHLLDRTFPASPMICSGAHKAPPY